MPENEALDPPGRSTSNRSIRPFVALGVVFTALVVGIVIVVLSQEDDSGSGADAADQTVEDISAGIVQSTDGVLSDDEAECMASSLVEQIGVDRAEELGRAVLDGGDLLASLDDVELASAFQSAIQCVPTEKLNELPAVLGADGS